MVVVKYGSLFALCYIILIFFPFFNLAPIQKQYREKFYPKKIIFTDEEVIFYGKDCSYQVGLGCIKKIINNDDYYKVCLRSGVKSGVLLCQKNIITQGTIEEFDEKFADLIVRKTE